jgi:hypothetical protein
MELKVPFKGRGQWKWFPRALSKYPACPVFRLFVELVQPGRVQSDENLGMAGR